MKVPRNKLNLLLIGAAIGIATWLFWESVSQPGLEQWSGKIEEMAFYRNENNTGPIRRIYTVYVKDATAEDMRAYADRMPYTKYGTTTVYFFSERDRTPKELRAENPHFDPDFNSYCIAVYEKNSMAQAQFRRNPFD